MNRPLLARSNPALLPFLVILIVGLSLFLKGKTVLDDPFHYGEYFASVTTGSNPESPAAHGVTLHGALDFIPALAAQHVWDDHHHFLPTFALYKFLDLGAAILLILVWLRVAGRSASGFWLLLAGTLASPYLVGYRDVFLLASVLTFLWLLARPRPGGWETAVGHVVLGCLAAANLFWSYDRGIAGTLSLGAAVLYLSLYDRRYAIALITFIAAIAALFLSDEPFSWPTYLANILVLVQTSSQWGYGLHVSSLVFSVFAIGMNALVFMPYWRSLRASTPEPARLAEAILFSILALMMLKIGTNRADLQHISWSLLVPFLLSLRLMEQPRSPNKLVFPVFVTLGLCALALAVRDKSYALPLLTATIGYPLLTVYGPDRRFSPFALLRTSVAASLVIALGFAFKSLGNGDYRWIAWIASPPDNALLSPEAIVRTAHQITASKTPCLFDMSNSGLLNGLTGLPSCSRFVYPIYAGARHETELIDAVRARHPPMIVYSSTEWSYRIDDKPMNRRFPNLDRFLRDTYPIETCQSGYCLRTQTGRTHLEQ